MDGAEQSRAEGGTGAMEGGRWRESGSPETVGRPVLQLIAVVLFVLPKLYTFMLCFLVFFKASH